MFYALFFEKFLRLSSSVVEQGIHKPKVTGSNPVWAKKSMYLTGLEIDLTLFNWKIESVLAVLEDRHLHLVSCYPVTRA